MSVDVMYVQQDVTVEADWDNLLKTVIGTYGRIDYAFNNAGAMARPKPGMNLTMKDWDWVLDTNIHGTLYGLRKFTGAMMMQPDGGHIITTASTASIAPFSMWGPYSVSKAAVLRLVETFKGEMLPEQFKSMQRAGAYRSGHLRLCLLCKEASGAGHRRRCVPPPEHDSESLSLYG